MSNPLDQLVCGQYDKEIRSAVRNVFSGKIVRMLLIQIQFIKKVPDSRR